MKKSILVAALIFVLLSATSCGVIDDAIEKAQSKDTIRIMRTVGEDSTFTRKKDITDEEMIMHVRAVFEEADWQGMPDDDRSHPNYRIETYDIWLPDDSTHIEAQDIESEAYTKLTQEQSEFIIQLMIDAFH